MLRLQSTSYYSSVRKDNCPIISGLEFQGKMFIHLVIAGMWVLWTWGKYSAVEWSSGFIYSKGTFSKDVLLQCSRAPGSHEELVKTQMLIQWSGNTFASTKLPAVAKAAGSGSPAGSEQQGSRAEGVKPASLTPACFCKWSFLGVGSVFCLLFVCSCFQVTVAEFGRCEKNSTSSIA